MTNNPPLFLATLSLCHYRIVSLLDVSVTCKPPGLCLRLEVLGLNCYVEHLWYHERGSTCPGQVHIIVKISPHQKLLSIPCPSNYTCQLEDKKADLGINQASCKQTHNAKVRMHKTQIQPNRKSTKSNHNDLETHGKQNRGDTENKIPLNQTKQNPSEREESKSLSHQTNPK